VPALLALALATVIALLKLGLRTPWQYAPFATMASLAALVTVAGWWLVARDAQALALVRDARDAQAGDAGAGTIEIDGERRSAYRRSRSTADDGAVLRGVTWVVAFAWGHEELRQAWSPAIATFALVAYYALVGVVTIGVGRLRGSATARKVGLALAVLAGLKAVVQAASITAIGLRVGSYLLVGAFLLGVAWWYRKGGDHSALDGDAVRPVGPPDGAGADSVASPPPTPGSARAVHNAG
jgi:hypothetical protein